MHKFLKPETTAHIGHRGVRLDSIASLDYVLAEGFGAIEGEKIVTDVQNPDTYPYFLLTVKPLKGMPFKMLTDGDEYIPLLGKTRLIIDRQFWSSKRPLTMVDQILIKEAIRLYTRVFSG